MKRAQGALEYLLLIGGAVLVATIVIALTTGIATRAGENIKQRIPTSFSGPNLVVNTSFEEWEDYWYFLTLKHRPKGWVLLDDWMLQGEEGIGKNGGKAFYFHDPPNMIWEWAGISYKIPKELGIGGKKLKATFSVKGDPANVGSQIYPWGFCSAPSVDVPCYKTVNVTLKTLTLDWVDYELITDPLPSNVDVYLVFAVRPGCSASPCIPWVTPNKEPTNVWLDDVQVEILKS